MNHVHTTSKVSALGQEFAYQCYQLKEQILSENILFKNIEDLNKQSRKKIREIAEKYGFLNCHLPYEKPYNEVEVFQLVMESQTEGQMINQHETQNILSKYCSIKGWDKLCRIMEGSDPMLSS